MIVVDASALVTALVDDGEMGERVRMRLRGSALVAPEIIDLEVLSVLRRLTANRTLSARRAAAAVGDLRDVPIRRIPHRLVIDRCWSLRSNATPYDAAYLAIAELFGAPLVTSDTKLRAVPGARCDVDVLG